MPHNSSLVSNRISAEQNHTNNNVQRRKSGANWRKRAKHTIKWLADGQDENIVKHYLANAAPDEVIKAITNAALNLKHGPVQISRQRKKLFVAITKRSKT